jgi:protein-disulfide isomerase
MIVHNEVGITSNAKNKKITSLIIFIAMGLVIAGPALLPSSESGQVAAQQAGSNNNLKLSLSALRQQGVPLLGNPSAPVTIIEFGDFQCPFCDRFAKETEPQINQTYIQTGKVNMLFVHLQSTVLILLLPPWLLNASMSRKSSGIFMIYYTRIKAL